MTDQFLTPFALGILAVNGVHIHVKCAAHQCTFLDLQATVTTTGETTTATASFNIDRTDYGIRYGSGSFFDNLGDKAIDNNFNVEVNIVATSEAPAKKAAKKGKPSSK